MYKRHHNQLVLFHESIVIAIADIVKRWFSDKEARFPERMPLLKDEEELLQVCHVETVLMSWGPATG